MAGKKTPSTDKPKVDRFENNWDDVPNFKLKDTEPVKPKKKLAAKKPKK